MSNQRRKYRVTATRSTTRWALRCVEFPEAHSEGDDFEEAAASIREAIAFELAVTEDSFEVVLDFDQFVAALGDD